MTAFLVVLHVLVSFFLVLSVLLQPGARGGVGAAFGGAGGQTVFGGRGANTFLAKLTAGAAVVFMLTSISLSFFGSSSTSVMSGKSKPAATSTDTKIDTPDAPDMESGPSGSGLAVPVGDPPPEPTPEE